MSLPAQRGSIWEASVTGGEILHVMVTERVEAGAAAPFEMYRVVPLTEYVRLIGAEDAIVCDAVAGDIFAAHMCLEGPVLPQVLLKHIGSIIEDPIKINDAPIDAVHADSIARYRESVSEQFDPLFSNCWARLYAELDA